MIFEELVKTTKDMQELQKKIDIQKNKEAQDSIDTRYRLLLTQIGLFVDCIEFLYSDIIDKNQAILESTIIILKKLEEATQSGIANGDDVKKAEELFKTLQIDIKKEWQKQYSSLTNAALSTLDAVKGIDPVSVSNCVTKIQEAEAWNNSLIQFKNLQAGLGEADKLIADLGLDDEIETFLRKTNEGKATLNDMSDAVFAWLKSEKLENKIRISFIKTSIK